MPANEPDGAEHMAIDGRLEGPVGRELKVAEGGDDEQRRRVDAVVLGRERVASLDARVVVRNLFYIVQ